MNLPAPDWLDTETQHLLDKAAAGLGLKPGQRIPAPEIRTDLRGLQAGQAFVEENLIRLNGDLLAAYGERFIADTLPHELAHLIVYRLYGRSVRPHGDEWVQVMRLFGASPERCHQYEVRPARQQQQYVYHCNCRIHQLSAVRHRRIQRGGRYLCINCGNPLRRKASPPAARQLELPLALP